MIKITLAGYLVYHFDAWVGSLSSQDAILGMDFMIPAGIRLDIAEGTLCLPDEIRIPLSGRRQAYSPAVQKVLLGDHVQLPAGRSIEIPIRSGSARSSKLWVTNGKNWIPTVTEGFGHRKFLRVTNLSNDRLVLQEDTQLGIWLPAGSVPRLQGFVSVGSRWYQEWQTLAWEATTDRSDEPEEVEEHQGPLVDCRQYATPTTILKREPDRDTSSVPLFASLRSQEVENNPPPLAKPDQEIDPKEEQDAGVIPLRHPDLDPDLEAVKKVRTDSPIGPDLEPDLKTDPKLEPKEEEADAVCYHEGGDLFAKDLERQMAVLPEVTTTEEVRIEDLQIGDPDHNTQDEVDRLTCIIWKRKHLLIGRGNALHPAAIGALCDIDVGGAAPIAQRCRRVAPQYREKLSRLIKGLLSAGIVVASIIIKKNGVDIRLCIDYRLVNSLTRLMVYPMPLVNDLLEDLDKVLWYCSLNMGSGFWVVSMRERARLISAFITPFKLFEWTRMPFGLKNAPQIYQRLIDNALYGHFRIRTDRDPSTDQIDVFEDADPEPEMKPSVLGRRSYIDDILINATAWDELCMNVEALLDTCEQWNLSISVVKSFWGYRQVDYLGHRVSADSLEANPNDLEALGNIPFPSTLRPMQSFLGSLNYYSRFIEEFAVYASVLYELREADFHEIKRRDESVSNTEGNECNKEEEDRWRRAKTAFTMLKANIVTTPILRHFDPDRIPVIVVYASKKYAVAVY